LSVPQAYLIAKENARRNGGRQVDQMHATYAAARVRAALRAASDRFSAAALRVALALNAALEALEIAITPPF